MVEENNLDEWDYVVIVIYFAFVIGVGLWVSTQPNITSELYCIVFSIFKSMTGGNRGNSQGYFLAGQNMWWFAVGSSLFASNIGSEHFIGMAGSGAAAGYGVSAFEMIGALTIQLLSWVFLPVYMASAIFTMPEYLRKRFGGQRIRAYLAILSLVLYILTKISVNLYCGAIFIQQSVGWDLYVSVISLLVITGLYTVTGGLKAVMYTDAAQCLIMVSGALVLMVYSFIAIGGIGALEEKYMEAKPKNLTNNTCGEPREDAFHLWRDPIGSDLPWTAFWLGEPAPAIWYSCMDQVIVQRALAAKHLRHGKGGTLFSGFLKVLPMFYITMPGMISRALWPEEIACVDEQTCYEVCGNKAGCTNIAYPKLVIELLPTGLRGLMLAVMISALMSSLTSIFNSGSTIFTVDIWAKLRKKTTEREKMIVGRFFVVILIIISVLWIPILSGSQGSELYYYIQQIAGYLTPQICAAFLVGMLWHRSTEQGVFWGQIIALLFGGTRLILDFVYPKPKCPEEDTRPYFVQLHYLYYAAIIFYISMIVTILVSLCTKPAPPNRLYRLTFWTRHSKKPRKDIDIPWVEDDYKEEEETSREPSGISNLGFEVEMKGLMESNSSNEVDEHNVNICNEEEKQDSRSDKVDVCASSSSTESKFSKKSEEFQDINLHNSTSTEPQQNETLPPSTISATSKDNTCWRKGYNWFCGFNETTEECKEPTYEEKQKIEIEHASKIIKENKKDHIFLNILLALLLSIFLAYGIVFA